MARTQKNKATSFHLGQLKAKLAKLKRELLAPTQGSGGGGGGMCRSTSIYANLAKVLTFFISWIRCRKNRGSKCWIYWIPIRWKKYIIKQSNWNSFRSSSIRIHNPNNCSRSY